MNAECWSFSFLIFNVIALQFIRPRGKKAAEPRPDVASLPQSERVLDVESILEREDEYIRHTASEAMQDRHTMINFYLVLVGVVASGILANFDKVQKWNGGATLLLWSVCSVGWFHFLILVRLREAWHDSMVARLQLRDFCVRRAQDLPPDELTKAFHWRRDTLPKANKPWSVFHYSAMLIGLLDSLAFGLGGYLLSVGWGAATVRTSIVLIVLSAILFIYHIWLYSDLLKEK